MFAVLLHVLPDLVRALGTKAAAAGAEPAAEELFQAARLTLPPGRFGLVAETLEGLARRIRAEAIRRGEE